MTLSKLTQISSKFHTAITNRLTAFRIAEPREDRSFLERPRQSVPSASPSKRYLDTLGSKTCCQTSELNQSAQQAAFSSDDTLFYAMHPNWTTVNLFQAEKFGAKNPLSIENFEEGIDQPGYYRAESVNLKTSHDDRFLIEVVNFWTDITMKKHRTWVHVYDLKEKRNVWSHWLSGLATAFEISPSGDRLVIAYTDDVTRYSILVLDMADGHTVLVEGKDRHAAEDRIVVYDRK